MSFKATFNDGGSDWIVLQCAFSLHQDVDTTGRPSSVTRGGNIIVTVESTDDTSLFEWMCDSYLKKDGTITFNKRDEDSKMKELNFIEAYMIGYEESFDFSGTGAMIITFTLSAKEISMGNGVHVNEWAI
jgi:hypothetical protein